MLLSIVCFSKAARAIGGDGCYFIQTFEDASQLPVEKQASEQLFNIEGQGEWIYYSSFQASNTSYIPDGSAFDLRLPKKGSYVVTPVLSSGVASVTFDIGRASVTAYISTDGGSTWTEAPSQTIIGKKVTVMVGSATVNRIKIANDTSKDADIDNLAVFAQTFETPVVVTTGDAADITTSGATLSGAVSKAEETVTEVGFVWSYLNKEPTLSDNVAAAALNTSLFTTQLTELREGATVYYRAFAKYGNTQTYGDS